MAIYRVEAPDKSIIRIEGPDNATPEQLASAVQAYAKSAAIPAAEPEKPLGIIDSLKESITGNRRATDTTNTLPDWVSMPEMQNVSVAGLKAALGTMASNPKETAQIMQANFPNVQVSQDEKGNYVFTSAEDGKQYALKPGAQWSDLPRGIGQVMAFGKAAGAKTLLGAAVKSGATQATIEGTQAATGGEINPAEVGVATALGPIAPALGMAATAGKNLLRRATDKVIGRAAQEVPNPVAGADIPPVVPEAPPAVEPLAAGDLAATAKKAAEGGRGSVKATEVLAEQAAPDAKTIEAAKRLGFDEYLQPDHVSSNQAYRELSQVLKSVPGSQIGAQSAKGLERAAAKSDELIEKLGGSKDLSEVGAGVKGELQSTHDTLKASAKKLYDEIDSALVQKAVPAPAPTVIDFVRARAKTLGGEENLTAGEKIILRKLAPKETQKPNSVEITQPTYALLDQVRKQIGAAKRGAQNAFGNADSKLLGDLEAALRADQGAVAKANGFGKKWEVAQATAKQYKGLQDDMVSLFGKNLDRSIVGPLGTAVKSLPSGDVERLVKLINLTPESLRSELVASGMLAAFKKNAVGGQLNFNTYAKWYEGLLNNKRAHAVVMSNLPKEARKQLSDLYRVSKGITLSEKEYIATGRLQTGIDAIKESFKPAETLIDRVYDVARRGAVGAVAGTVVTPVLGPGVGAAVASALTKQSAKTSALKAADELIASQAFADAVKAAASKGANSGEAKKKAVLRLAYSAPFKKLVKELNNPKEMSNPEKWILQSLEASNQSKSNQ